MSKKKNICLNIKFHLAFLQRSRSFIVTSSFRRSPRGCSSSRSQLARGFVASNIEICRLRRRWWHAEIGMAGWCCSCSAAPLSSAAVSSSSFYLAPTGLCSPGMLPDARCAAKDHSLLSNCRNSNQPVACDPPRDTSCGKPAQTPWKTFKRQSSLEMINLACSSLGILTCL